MGRWVIGASNGVVTGLIDHLQGKPCGNKKNAAHLESNPLGKDFL